LTIPFTAFAHALSGLSDSEPYDLNKGHVFEDDQRTALHIAVLKNDQAMVSNLLMEQADPSVMDAY
jgi:ankyrin repeat protein